MSEMPSRDEFEQYKSLRDKGDYRAAAKVLLPYKGNPKVRTLIQQLKAAHESGSLPSKSAVKTKRKPNFLKWVGIGVVAVIGVCVALFAAIMVWYEISGTGDEITDILISAKMTGLCVEIYYEDYVYNDAFSEACEQETDLVMTRYKDELRYCYEQTQNGNLEAQFIDCLVENEVQFSGAFMLGLQRR